ncbi:uncharacterized protein LOC135341670 [Halichondria panicea]|uniref:uncharacterized protein LOC135341670 n=1 Tax=Halichondria panicea TaxID=6063 RepID=UPI00312BB92A
MFLTPSRQFSHFLEQATQDCSILKHVHSTTCKDGYTVCEVFLDTPRTPCFVMDFISRMFIVYVAAQDGVECGIHVIHNIMTMVKFSGLPASKHLQKSVNTAELRGLILLSCYSTQQSQKTSHGVRRSKRVANTDLQTDDDASVSVKKTAKSKP